MNSDKLIADLRNKLTPIKCFVFDGDDLRLTKEQRDTFKEEAQKAFKLVEEILDNAGEEGVQHLVITCVRCKNELEYCKECGEYHRKK